MKPVTPKQMRIHREARHQLSIGQVREAERHLDDLVRKNPHPDFLLDRAKCRIRRGAYRDARGDLERILKEQPGSAVVHLHMALCHRMEQKLDAALRALDECLRLRPSMDEARARKAELLHIRGDYDGALAILEPLVTEGTTDASVLLEHGRLCALKDRTDDAVTSLERSAELGEGTTSRTAALFELAQVHEKRGAYDAAWEAAGRANATMPRRYDADAHRDMADRIAAAWTPEAAAEAPRSSVDDPAPVLITGMPRSGTTLVEQILASHPKVAAGGERPTLHQLVRDLEPHADALPARVEDPSALSAGALDRLARAYVKDLRKVSRDAERVTDKNPFNFMHLGLVGLALPRATVIHCTRNPMDVAISCWFNWFRGAVWFANDLEAIASFTVDVHDRLMECWRGLAPTLGLDVLEVPYESMVDDLEGAARRIIDHAGLEWDDACLRPHETDRIAWTASIDQVRRPIYGSSVQRWKHYETQLGPLLPRFGMGAGVARRRR